MPTIQPAYTGTEKYIFISYSHKDADEVYPVIARLQEEGYRIWYDEGNKCGDDFNKKIAAHIKKCYCFITLMSENYLASEYCIDELTYSYNKVNNRFFIFLQDVVLPDDIELRNAKYHHLFKYKYDSDESFFSELLESDNIKPCKGPVSAFSKDGEYYEGDMSDGKRHGRGILYMVSGNVYEGDFENGKPHGKGRFTWANGDVYEGDWVNGEREGKGRYLQGGFYRRQNNR